MSVTVPFEDLVKDVNDNYLRSLIRRNPALIEAAVSFHQRGEIPPNTYVLDLDTHRRNGKATTDEAAKFGIALYFMSKAIGWNPIVTKSVIDQGFLGAVAVESQGAKVLHKHGIKVSHVGHLVQIPVHDIDYILSMEPEVWTVYSVENARAVSEVARRRGRIQNLLIRPVGREDIFYETMSGGIPENQVVDAVKKINSFEGVRVVGTTSFPCMLYDVGKRKIVVVPNFETAVRAARTLESQLGMEITQINTPGNNNLSAMKIIAENGGTHGEPGVGVSGANTLNAMTEQVEIPAFVYVSEISHWLNEKLYAHGGGLNVPGGGWGLYPDGSLWGGGNSINLSALVGSTSASAISNVVKVKNPGKDPHNYNITLLPEDKKFSVGDAVIFGFVPPQVFVSRAWHVVVSGLEDNNPQLVGIFDQGNNLIDKHGHLLGNDALNSLMKKYA
jgi:predicted amino acid racemase